MIFLTLVGSLCCQLVALLPLVPLLPPRLPLLPLSVCRKCNALGRLLVSLSLWALVVVLTGTSLCHISLVTLAPLELVAALLLAQTVALLLDPPLEVVREAVLVPPSELAPVTLLPAALFW